jgi:hypothetical protein
MLGPAVAGPFHFIGRVTLSKFAAALKLTAALLESKVFVRNYS